MLNNSFNRVVQCIPNYLCGRCKDIGDNTDDWEAKYNVSLSILELEYSRCFEQVSHIDEKASKYLVIISIAMTGFFVMVSSSATDNLEFNYLLPSLSFSLTLLFIDFLLISLILGFVVIRASLNCFSLVKIKKMPNLVNALHATKEQTVAQYKDYLINSYQQSIDSLDKTIEKKQVHIAKISENTKYFILFLFLSLMTLIILKTLG